MTCLTPWVILRGPRPARGSCCPSYFALEPLPSPPAFTIPVRPVIYFSDSVCSSVKWAPQHLPPGEGEGREDNTFNVPRPVSQLVINTCNLGGSHAFHLCPSAPSLLSLQAPSPFPWGPPVSRVVGQLGMLTPRCVS